MCSHGFSDVLEQELTSGDFPVKSCFHQLGQDHIYDEKLIMGSKHIVRNLDTALNDYCNIEWNNAVEHDL